LVDRELYFTSKQESSQSGTRNNSQIELAAGGQL